MYVGEALRWSVARTKKLGGEVATGAYFAAIEPTATAIRLEKCPRGLCVLRVHMLCTRRPEVTGRGEVPKHATCYRDE
jgi:hypothetical protein